MAKFNFEQFKQDNLNNPNKATVYLFSERPKNEIPKFESTTIARAGEEAPTASVQGNVAPRLKAGPLTYLEAMQAKYSNALQQPPLTYQDALRARQYKSKDTFGDKLNQFTGSLDSFAETPYAVDNFLNNMALSHENEKNQRISEMKQLEEKPNKTFEEKKKLLEIANQAVRDMSPGMVSQSFDMMTDKDKKLKELQVNAQLSNNMMQGFANEESENYNKLTDGMTNSGKFLVDTARGGVNMLNVASRTATMGIPIIAEMGGAAGVEAGSRAIKEGYSTDKAFSMGLGSAAITAGIESLGGIGGNVLGKAFGKGAATQIGKNILSKIPTKILGYVTKASNSIAGNILKSSLSEGVEEGTEYVLQTFYENLLLDKNTPYDIKVVADNMLSGAILGGVFGTGKAISAYNSPTEIANRAEAKELNRIDNEYSLMQDGNMFTKNQSQDSQTSKLPLGPYATAETKAAYAEKSKEEPGIIKTGLTVQDGIASEPSSSYKPTILQEKSVVNNHSMQKSSENEVSQSTGISTAVNGSERVGKATTIKSPYKGETPSQANISKTKPVVTVDNIKTASSQIEEAKAKAAQTGKSLRNYLTDFYNTVFEEMGGARGVEVNGVKFGDKNYIVTVNKNAVSKVIADNNLSVEKLALFDVLDDIIENGEFVGSGEYIQHGNRNKKTTRFDYFETPVSISGKEYIATFDVEVFPWSNNYRTHKVINKMDLVPISRADTVLLSAASEKTTSPLDTTISQSINGVNTYNMQKSSENAVSVAFDNDNQNLYAINQDFTKTMSAVKSAGRSIYQNVVSGQSPLERMQKANSSNNPNIDAATQLARQSGGTVDSIAEDALVTPFAEKIGISYKKLMELIPKQKLEVFNDYAQNLHNVDRMSLESKADVEGAINDFNQFSLDYPEIANAPEWEVKKWAKETGVTGELARGYYELIENIEKQKSIKNKPVNTNTAEESRRIVAEYERLYPNFRQISDTIQDWWGKFSKAWLVDTGQMNRESYKAMREMYPHYIPTFREEKQKPLGSGMFGRAISTPNVVRKAQGGTSKIIPLEETFMMQIDRIVKAARRNDLGKTLIDFALHDPEIAMINGVKLSLESGGESKVSDVDSFIDDVDTKTLEQLDNGGYQLTVLNGGEKVKLDISQDVYDGLKWLQDSGFSETWVKNVVGIGKKITAPVKTAITGINALFAVTNTIRDIQTLFVNSVSNNPVQIISNYGKAIVDVAKKREVYQKYKALGGARSGFYGQQRGFKDSLKTPFNELSGGQKVARVAKAIPTSPFRAFAKLGELSEQIARVTEFRNAIEKYGNTPEGLKRAAFASSDVTVNFSRNAPITKVCDAWVMYLNAQVQGLDKTVRQIKNRPIATLSKALVTVTLPTLILMLINRENPYYDDLDDRTKDNYFIIPNTLDTDEDGNAKTFIKLPKSREWGAILSSSFDRIAKYMETRDLAEAFRGYSETLRTSFMPTDITTNNIISPITHNLKNNVDFAGRPIVPKSLEHLSSQLQYDINTSGIAKNVGKALNLSPKQVDYLIDSYAGYPGDIIQALSSPKNIGRTPLETAVNAIQNAIIEPFERRFTAKPNFSSFTINKLYYEIDEATKEASYKNYEEGIPLGAVTPEEKRKSYLMKAATDISALRKKENEMLAESMGLYDKKRKSEKIREEMNKIARQAIDTVDDYVEAYEKGYVPEISHLSEKMQSEWRKIENDISAELFSQAYAAQKSIVGDKDKEGNAIYLSASKNKKSAIDEATPKLGRKEREKLYKIFGVSEKVW